MISGVGKPYLALSPWRWGTDADFGLDVREGLQNPGGERSTLTLDIGAIVLMSSAGISCVHRA